MSAKVGREEISVSVLTQISLIGIITIHKNKKPKRKPVLLC